MVQRRSYNFGGSIVRYKKSARLCVARSVIFSCCLNSSALYAEFRYEPNSSVGAAGAPVSRLAAEPTGSSKSRSVIAVPTTQAKHPSPHSSWRFSDSITQTRLATKSNFEERTPAKKQAKINRRQIAQVLLDPADSTSGYSIEIVEPADRFLQTQFEVRVDESNRRLLIDQLSSDPINVSPTDLLILESGVPRYFVRLYADTASSPDEILVAAATALLSKHTQVNVDQIAAATYLHNSDRFTELANQTTQALRLPTKTVVEAMTIAKAHKVMSGVRLYGVYKTNSSPNIQEGDRLKDCANFDFALGLLKANLNRFLTQCGYSIGQWALGDSEYEYDFQIPKAYVLRVEGLDRLLESVEATYLIRGTRNTLDKTVDFEASRGAILEGMEIKQW